MIQNTIRPNYRSKHSVKAMNSIYQKTKMTVLSHPWKERIKDTNKSYNRKLTAQMGIPRKSQLSKQTHPSQWKHMENWAAKEKASSQEKKRNTQTKEKEPVYPALELGKEGLLSICGKQVLKLTKGFSLFLWLMYVHLGCLLFLIKVSGHSQTYFKL
jgi:hypothetical protein